MSCPIGRTSKPKKGTESQHPAGHRHLPTSGLISLDSILPNLINLPSSLPSIFAHIDCRGGTWGQTLVASGGAGVFRGFTRRLAGPPFDDDMDGATVPPRTGSGTSAFQITTPTAVGPVARRYPIAAGSALVLPGGRVGGLMREANVARLVSVLAASRRHVGIENGILVRPDLISGLLVFTGWPWC